MVPHTFDDGEPLCPHSKTTLRALSSDLSLAEVEEFLQVVIVRLLLRVWSDEHDTPWVRRVPCHPEPRVLGLECLLDVRLPPYSRVVPGPWGSKLEVVDEPVRSPDYLSVDGVAEFSTKEGLHSAIWGESSWFAIEVDVQTVNSVGKPRQLVFLLHLSGILPHLVCGWEVEDLGSDVFVDSFCEADNRVGHGGLGTFHQ